VRCSEPAAARRRPDHLNTTKVSVRSVPNINQPVTVTDVHDHVYPSRVEDAAPGVLVVARPFDLPAEHAPAIGTEILIAWTTSRGVAVLPGRLAGARQERTVRLWVVEITGEAWFEQRRQYVRVPALGHVTLLISNAELGTDSALGDIVDVSEAALCCSIEPGPTEVLLTEGIEITARFRLGHQFELPGHIAKRRPGRRSPGRAELVVRFDTIDTQADRLRREVFAHQLRLRNIAAP
jgi:c-di-GMP-binding flagellar brake protein YcgR